MNGLESRLEAISPCVVLTSRNTNQLNMHA